MHSKNPPPSPARLRGHHLICLHFYSGEGYSEDFVTNLESVIKKAEEYGVEVCCGADDICNACPSCNLNRCSHTEHAEEEIKGMDNRALRLLRVHQGETVQWGSIRKDLPDLFPQWHTTCCNGCNWKKACEKKDFYRQLKAHLSL